MKENRVEQALREQMGHVQVSSRLRAQTIQAMQEKKEEKQVKHKIRTELVMVLICVLCAAVALAAAGHMGLLDYMSRPQGTGLPDDAETYIDTDVATAKVDEYTVNVREAYYDGERTHLAVDIVPPKGVLLTSDMLNLSDNWQNLVQQDEWDESDTRTILDYYKEGGYTKICSVDMWEENPEEKGRLGDSYTWVLSEDNVMTIFMEVNYSKERPQHDLHLMVAVAPYDDLEAPNAYPNYEKQVTAESVLPLAAKTVETDTPYYINEEPILFESIGVRVDRVVMEEKPLEIDYTIEYTIVDREKYARTDDGLWFEFIDPNSTETEAWAQRLKDGPSGAGQSGPVDGDFETAAHFVETGTLAVEEKSDSYTLRAYECWEKRRFDTCTVNMRPASQEEAKIEEPPEEQAED